MKLRLRDSSVTRGAKQRVGMALCLCASAIAAVLAEPTVMRADTVYVSSWNSDQILRFTTEGAGSIFYSGGSDFRATGLAFDRAGTLYAATRSSGIYRFAPDGTLSLFPSMLGLNYPRGIAFDSASNLFVANYFSDEILKFAPDGSGTVLAFRNGVSFPTDVAIDPVGNLYVANAGGNTIMKFTPDGQGTFFATNGLGSPVGLAVDGAGNLYVADQLNNTILKFTPDGVGSVFASTGLSAPSDLAFDSAGNLLVANTGNNTIQRFTPSGVGSLFASTGTNAPAYIVVEMDPVSDSDGDGVADDVDQCPGSARGAVVDLNGCTIDQLVPCNGPAPGRTWKNRGQYMSAFEKTADAFAAAGLITLAERDALVRAASRSDCGRKR